MVAFLLAFLLLCFQHTSAQTWLPVAGGWVVIALLIVWCIWTSWESHPDSTLLSRIVAKSQDLTCQWGGWKQFMQFSRRPEADPEKGDWFVGWLAVYMLYESIYWREAVGMYMLCILFKHPSPTVLPVPSSCATQIRQGGGGYFLKMRSR